MRCHAGTCIAEETPVAAFFLEKGKHDIKKSSEGKNLT
jgi:hypothetical protein